MVGKIDYFCERTQSAVPEYKVQSPEQLEIMLRDSKQMKTFEKWRDAAIAKMKDNSALRCPLGTLHQAEVVVQDETFQAFRMYSFGELTPISLMA